MGFFKKRTVTPIEERNYASIYIIFSALLFLGTVWAVVDEVKVRRPWKEYQREFYEIGVKKLEEQYAEALSRVDSAKYQSIQIELARAQAALEGAEYQEALKTAEKLRIRLDEATRDWRFARSRSDAAYYGYKKNLREGKQDPKGQQQLDELDEEIRRRAAEMDSLNQKIARVDAVINRYKDHADSLTAELKGIFAEAQTIAAKIERMRSAPIEVRQTVLNDFDKTNFGELKARVDRCVTCHMGYHEQLYSDAPQPFRTHPVPELLSLHNPEKFGCTPCHRGQGTALTAGDAHGEADPYWEAPILKGQDVYAGCNSCHASEFVLKFAPRLTRAKQLLMESGCFGCHEIKNFQNLPKIGPDLNELTKKVKPEWIFRWVRNPKDYTPHTRMPNFRFTDEQAEAVTAYLVSVSRESSYRPTSPPGSYKGGVATRGKETFETVGCKGCHVVGEDTRMRAERGTSYDIAPELTWVGGKVDPDWLFDWIRNPRHYHPNTRMPSLRLTDTEARDIVAYLSSLHDERPSPVRALDLNNKDKIAQGLNTIREYGCFGCHNIKGTEKEGKVSVELSDFGKKYVEQMDFGDTNVPHTWDDWVKNKLRDSRVFQTDRIVQKMPVFSFTDDEIETLRMLLKSFQKEGPSEKHQQAVTKRQRDIDAGRALTMWYNCINCHNLEDRGGAISALLEDQALSPPPITGEGAKVQEQWLHDFLKNPSVIRPWLKIRMPTFSLTDEEIGTITKYFLGLAKQDFALRDYSATPIDPRFLVPGKQLFDSYQCAKCHPAGPVKLGEGGVVAANLAPNLALAATRLKPEWIVDWLQDPQQIQPGTQMPTFFYEGQVPDDTILEGDANKQIQALRTYVWSLGKRGPVVVGSR
jgi:mono/diheme cytochrome c family protein